MLSECRFNELHTNKGNNFPKSKLVLFHMAVHMR